MATVRVPVLVVFEYDESDTTGPDYGNEPMTPEFIRGYVEGAGDHIVPNVRVHTAETGRVSKSDEDGRFRFVAE